MIIRTLNDLAELGRIKFPADGTFRSARFVTAADGLGFSYNENRVKKGFDLQVWLKHHWEANYIVSGAGEVIDLTTSDHYPLRAGVLYVVGPNDRHQLRFTEDECHISVFCPPLTGEERFDEDGSYEPSGPIAPTERRMFAKDIDEVRVETKPESGEKATRMLTAADDVGFEMTLLTLPAGQEHSPLRGQKSVVHILTGQGEIADLRTKDAYTIGESSACLVHSTDEVKLTASEDLLALCIRSTNTTSAGA